MFRNFKPGRSWRFCGNLRIPELFFCRKTKNGLEIDSTWVSGAGNRPVLHSKASRGQWKARGAEIPTRNKLILTNPREHFPPTQGSPRGHFPPTHPPTHPTHPTHPAHPTHPPNGRKHLMAKQGVVLHCTKRWWECQEHDRQSESHQHKWEVISAAESTTCLQEISAAEWNSAHFVSIYIAAHVLWCTHTHTQAHMNTHTSGARSTERKPSTQMRSHLSCRVHDISSRDLSCWMKLCPFRVYLYRCTCTLVHTHTHKHTWTHIRQEHNRQSESHQHKWEVISAAESTTFLQEISAAEWNSAHFVSIYIAAHVLWCTHTHTSTHEHTYVRSTIDRAKAINTNEKSSQLPSPRHFFKKSQLLNETLPISCLSILLHMYFGARTRTQAHMNTHTSGARSTERKPSTQMRSHLSCRVHDISSRNLSCWMKLCPFRVYLYCCTCTLVHAHAHKHTWTHIRQEHDRQSESHQHKWEVISAAESTTLLQEISAAEWNSAHFVSIYIAAHVLWCTHTHTSTHEHTYVRSTIDRAKAINTNEKSSQLPSPRHFFKKSQLLNETLPISCLFILLHMYFGARTRTQAHMNTHTSGARSTERKPSTQMRSHLSCRVHDISSRNLSCWMKLCPFRVYLYCCTCTLVHAHAHKHTWTHIRQEHDRQSESHQHKWEVISAAESTTFLQEISAAEWNSAHFVSIYIAAHVLWCTHTHTHKHTWTHIPPLSPLGIEKSWLVGYMFHFH